MNDASRTYAHKGLCLGERAACAQPNDASVMRATFAICFFLGLCAAALPPVHAKTPPSNPVGAGWQTQNTVSGSVEGRAFDTEQIELINRINVYFNALRNLKARFVQKDADGKVTKGKLFIQKPGRFRFEYARPSRKIIISDGRFLAIQDRDLKNEDTYELNNTPFRILLRRDVNLLRDARIHQLKNENGNIVLTLSDKNPDAVGNITISMKENDEKKLVLSGWVTMDAQGLKTAVTINSVSYPRRLKRRLFVREKLYLNQLNQAD